MNPWVVFFLGYLGPQLEKERERENEKRKTFWCRSPKRLSKARIKKKSQNQNRLNLRSPRILIVMWLVQDWKKESESHSVMSDSLWLHGWPHGLHTARLHCLWNFPGRNTGFVVCVLVTQSCPTLCKPMDCNLPGSSVHGILQARILEWVAIPFSRGSS